MQNGKIVLASDVDGTIIWLSLPSRVHQFISRHKVLLIILLPILPFYLLRPRKKSAKMKIRKYWQEGTRVVFVSATVDIFFVRWLMRAWFKLWGVPYHRMALCPHGSTAEEHKLKILLEERCDIFLEDEACIIDYLIGKSMDAGIRLINIITKDGYSTIHFSTFDPFADLSS